MKDTDLALQLVLNTFFGNPLNEEGLQALQTQSLKGLFSFCKKQDISHLIFPAVRNLEVGDKEVYKKFQSQYFMTVLMAEEKQKTAQNVYGIFEQNGVEFMPLKGELISKYYPQPFMRISCDVDILVREEKFSKAKKLLESNGFAEKSRTLYDVSLRAQSGVTVELHRKLLEDDKNTFIKDRLENVFDIAEKCQGREYRYKFKDDYFYYYNFVHLTKHFAVGGCGLKHFYDLYFLSRNADFNVKAGEDLIEKNGLKEFYDNCMALSFALTGNGEYTERLKKMLEFVLDSGIFGKEENKTIVYVAQNNGKFKYLLKKIFLPRKYLAENYPVVQKHKILTPLFEVVRWFDLVFRRMKNTKAQGKIINSVDKKKVNDRVEFYKSLGINIK